MHVVEKRRGAWLVDKNGVVLSEVQSDPKATGSVFDLIAASIATLSAGPRCALLGFAAGGVIAPLRAMGYQHPIDAVDLSRRGERVFRRISNYPVDDVRVAEAEASAWLRRKKKPFDVIVDDLSMPHPTHEVVKPRVSFEVLPDLMRAKLTAKGAAVFNLLSYPNFPWTRLIPQVAAPFKRARLLQCDDFENRLLLVGERLPSARALSSDLRTCLRKIRSRQAERFSLQTVK